MQAAYSELSELIVAMGTSWFENTLPGVLQSVIEYDYFLFAMYEHGEPLRIVRSDFHNVAMQQTLKYLTSETYVNEPIFRLFNAAKTRAGVFDMKELTERSQRLPEPIDLTLPHLIVDESEEIGWRTDGWPEYQQETCILMPLQDGRLSAVSLYNFGLVQKSQVSSAKLSDIYPVIAAIVSRHFELLVDKTHRPSVTKLNHLHKSISQSAESVVLISTDEVTRFFKTAFGAEVTKREAAIFKLLLQGSTLSAIADELFISIYTARTHRRNVYRKIGHGRLLELINQFHLFRSNDSTSLAS